MGLFSRIGAAIATQSYLDDVRKEDCTDYPIINIRNWRSSPIRGVGRTLSGKLMYRRKGSLRNETTGIAYTKILGAYPCISSKIRYDTMYTFMLVLTTGESVTVNTNDGKLIDTVILYTQA